MNTADYWDAEAATFDEAPDHGLADPHLRQRWRELLSGLLPAPGDVLDVGCGTGTLSVLMAELGHRVTGIDASPAMIAAAERKSHAAGMPCRFLVQDAGAPVFEPASFDIVLGRHILWALPDQVAVLGRWRNLLRPGGRLVMIEGFWQTGVGLRRQQVLDALPGDLSVEAAKDLAADPLLWGRDVEDERYMVVARCT